MFGPSQRLVKILGLVLVALAFYFIARIEFLAWNWNLFRNKTTIDILWALFVGFRFDISAVLSITAPVLLLSFIPWPKKWESRWEISTWAMFCLLQIPFLILNLVDTEFINFVGRRFTYDTLFMLSETQGKMTGFVSTYWQLFLINTLLAIAFAVISWKVLRAQFFTLWTSNLKNSAKHWRTHLLFYFMAVAVSIVGIRGGFQLKPISFVNANIFTVPALNNLVLNSSFTLIKSYGKTSLKREKYFSDHEQVFKNLNGSFNGSLLEGKRPEGSQNVVILILESFGAEYIGPVNGKSYTPFLDSLMARSLVFENAYANGRRSIEGVAAVMGGIPALMSEPFISSNFTTNYFLGLGTLLSPRHYSTAFFHGGHNGTMHFDSFMQSAGIEHYYGSKEYNNSSDDDGIWGIWDEPFLQFTVKKMNQMPEPFMASVFTISSHHPFKIPDKYKDQFPEGPSEILKTISYTDMALKKFFAEAQKSPWFKNTLFIITADHTSKHYRPEYESDVGDYRVPLFLYHPAFQFPAVDTNMVVQQIDILPTVLDFLGLPSKEKNYLGSSMFIPGDKQAVNFIDGRYLLFSKDYHAHWTPGHGDPEIFSIQTQNKDIAVPLALKEKLTEKLKATIQYFNDGMWDNKLYYPTLRN